LDYGNQGGIGLQAATVSKAGTLNTSSKIQVSSVPSTATWSRYVYPVFAKSNTTSMLVWLDNSETSGIQKGLVGLPMAPF
jgi:hypothetical protein